MGLVAGEVQRGTTADFSSFGGSGQMAHKRTVPAAGTIRHVYMHGKVANAALSALQCRIYADSAGAPGAALTAAMSPNAGSTITNANATRWDLAADLAVSAGQVIWVAFRYTGEQFDWQGDAVAGVYLEKADTGSLADPWTGGSVGGNTPAIALVDAPIPAVIATSVLADAADATNHNVPYPAPPGGIAAGDLLVCHVGEDAAAGTDAVTFPAGWTELVDTRDATNAVNGAVAFRRAAGGESGTFLVQTAAAQGGGIRCQCIRGAHASSDPELTSATASSTNPNPPSETASWGAEEGILWLAGAANDGNVAITAAPASFGDFANTRWANTAGAGVATAWRYLTPAAATLDPGTFTMATEQWVAWTIAVRAQPTPSGSTPKAGSETGTGADASTSPSATTSGAETGAGSETASVAASTSATDAGVGVETAVIFITSSDAGAAVETAAVAASRSGTAETATGADASSATAAIAATDLGAAVDIAGTPAVTTSAADTGAGAETSNVVTGNFVSGSDTGAGADASAPPAATLSTAEAGAGAETASVARSSLATDSGTVAEASSVAGAIAGADQAAGLETSRIGLSALETAIGADAATLLAATAAVDVAIAVDVGALVAAIAAVDVGAGLDLATIPSPPGAHAPGRIVAGSAGRVAASSSGHVTPGHGGHVDGGRAGRIDAGAPGRVEILP